MKINKKEKTKCYVSSIEVGNCFKYADDIYMRIRGVKTHNGASDSFEFQNCVCLRTGVVCDVQNEVTPLVDVELTVLDN